MSVSGTRQTDDRLTSAMSEKRTLAQKIYGSRSGHKESRLAVKILYRHVSFSTLGKDAVTNLETLQRIYPTISLNTVDQAVQVH